MRPLKFLVALLLAASSVAPAYAHTNSVGYVSNGDGSITIWFGNWHQNTSGVEGYLKLESTENNGFTTTTSPFTQLLTSTPKGLIPGTNWYSSDGKGLVAYKGDPKGINDVMGCGGSSKQCTSFSFQGITFKGLKSGTYRFTYVPITNSSQDWDPMDSSILSSEMKIAGSVSSSLANTIISLGTSAAQVRTELSNRASLLANGLAYDTDTFGTSGWSLSFIGRYSSLSDTNEGAGALVAAYKVTPEIRIGAYLDHTVARNDPTGIKTSDSTPIVGAFAVYEENKDLTGLSLRASSGFHSGNMTVMRDVSIGDTEAGAGKARVRAFGVSAEAGYGSRLSDDLVAVPYAGIRYTDVVRKAYSETNGIEQPLSYNDFGQKLTTALLGARFHNKLTDQMSAILGLGIEYDLLRAVDSYSGTSTIQDLESFAIATTATPNRIRASASLGLAYQIAPTESLAAQISVRQQGYAAVIAATAMVKYSVGF